MAGVGKDQTLLSFRACLGDTKMASVNDQEVKGKTDTIHSAIRNGQCFLFHQRLHIPPVENSFDQKVLNQMTIILCD
jgi:hypothetical protein